MVFLVDMFSILARVVDQPRTNWRMEEALKGVVGVLGWTTRRWKTHQRFGPCRCISDAIALANTRFLPCSKVDEQMKTTVLSLLQVKLEKKSPAKRGKGEYFQLQRQHRGRLAELLLLALCVLKVPLLVGKDIVSSAGVILFVLVSVPSVLSFVGDYFDNVPDLFHWNLMRLFPLSPVSSCWYLYHLLSFLSRRCWHGNQKRYQNHRLRVVCDFYRSELRQENSRTNNSEGGQNLRTLFVRVDPFSPYHLGQKQRCLIYSY